MVKADRGGPFCRARTEVRTPLLASSYVLRYALVGWTRLILDSGPSASNSSIPSPSPPFGNPIHVSLFCLQSVLPHPQRIPHSIHQPYRPIRPIDINALATGSVLSRITLIHCLALSLRGRPASIQYAFIQELQRPLRVRPRFPPRRFPKRLAVKVPLNLRHPHVVRMAAVVKQDIASHPLHISTCGVVVNSTCQQRLQRPIQQLLALGGPSKPSNGPLQSPGECAKISLNGEIMNVDICILSSRS